MKCAALTTLVLLTMSLGCAHKKTYTNPKPQMYVTKDCIVGFTKVSKCEPLPPDLALCHDVVMKLACVRVEKH